MRLAVLTAALLCALAVPVSAAKLRDPARSPDLWATINVCDTAAHPNTIGIRGSMPGIGRPATLWMRFQVQYLAKTDGKWHNIDTGNADSNWKRLGRSATRVTESGQDFTFLPPANGSHTLRGSVWFKWVRRGHVLRKLRRITTAGHRSTAGADPAGYSAAVCEVVSP